MKALKVLPATLLLIPALASAQPEPQLGADTTAFDHPVAPVSNALELGIATGYAQGGGKLGGTMQNLEDVAGPGAAVEVDAGWRIIPNLSVGAYGTFSQYQHGDQLDSNTKVFGASAGVQAALHLRPDAAIDPWVSLGGGWKGLWFDPDGARATSLQGFDLARLQIGADYRLTKDIALTPVIGGALSMYVSEDATMPNDFTEIQDKKVNVTGFAGVAGRFDLGGRR